MSQLRTYKFWLEDDRQLPMFKRFRWQSVPVSMEDVLLKGVHPVVENGLTDWVLERELLRKMNQDDSKVPSLSGTRYSYDISDPRYQQNSQHPLLALFGRLQGDVYFVDELDQQRLYQIARDHLQATWGHSRALNMSKALHCQFGDLRKFLKSKDKTLKLSGYDDLSNYDLGSVLSVDDFQEHEHLVVDQAFPIHNFRSSNALQQLTDEQGRVRLAPEIKFLNITIRESSKMPGVIGTMFDYSLERSGNMVTFRPDIAEHDARRRVAEKFSRKWRSDDRRLVFKAPLESLLKLVEEEEVRVSFPGLTYSSTPKAKTVHASLPKDWVDVRVVGGFCTSGWRGESLKDVLSEFGKSTSGTKEQMLNRLAALGAEKYEEHQEELDQYFNQHKFIRVNKEVREGKLFPVLQELKHIGRLVLAMYVLKHLRGNTILDPEHMNQAYSSSQLADALVHGRVAIGGGFVKVA